MRLLLTASLLLTSVAAEAQFVPRSPPSSDRMPGIVDRGTLPQSPSFGHDLGRARNLIGQGIDEGSLSRKQGKALRREARQIDALAERYGRDGLSDSEQRELDMRIQVLRARTLAERSPGKP